MQMKACLLFTTLVAIGCNQQDPDVPRNGNANASEAGTSAAAGRAAPGPGPGPETAGAAAALSGSGGSAQSGSAGAAGVDGGPRAAGSPSQPDVTAPDEQNERGSLFPLKTGNSWSFRTTKGSEVGNKTQTVGALEMVGGAGPKSSTMAFKMLTTKDDGMDKTESWQAEVDGKIVRYRERAYAASNGALEIEEYWEPYKLRIDGTQLAVGTTYTEQYRETKILTGETPATANSSDVWKVVAVDEKVTVPAGTFTAVVIEKVGGTSSKRYWFARGVGKVKEQSGAQLEELTSYKLMP